MFGIVCRTHSTDTLKSAESPLNLLRYVLFKRGMLASAGVEGFAFAQVHPGPVAAPDLEIMFLPFERRSELLEPPREHAFTIASAVVSPRSRGRLNFRSPDPLVPPGIDFGLLSDPDGIDASVACEGIRLCRRIIATAPLAAHSAGEMRPGASIESDRDLLAFASQDMQTVYHPTSTCRMEDWQGQWIGFDGDAESEDPQAKALRELLTFRDSSWFWTGGAKAGNQLAGPAYFRTEIEIPAGSKVAQATFLIAADDAFTLYVNGHDSGNGHNWKNPSALDVTGRLQPGRNALGIQVTNGGTAPSPAGLMGKLVVLFQSGYPLVVPIDASWRSSRIQSA